MNLRSHTSVPNKLEVPNVNSRKQCIHVTFLFQVWISVTFKNNWHLRCILRQQVKTNALRCSQSNRVQQNSSTGGSDQKDPEEPKLVLDPMWYVVFCTCRRSGRSCMLMLQLQRQDQEEYIHLEFVLHLVISKWSSAGGMSMEYLDSRCLDKRWRRNAIGEVLKCWTGWTETYKKSSPRALIERKYGSPRIPDTSEPSSMRSRNVSWSRSRTLSFSTSGINITVPAWICGSSSSLYPKSWSSVRSLSCILLAMNESVKTLLDPGISKFRSCEPQAWKTKVKINLTKIAINFLSILQIQRSHV